MQHGSIRLQPDPSPVRVACGLPGGATTATSLAEQGGQADPESALQACQAAFARALGAPLEPGCLSAVERGWASDRLAAHDPTGGFFDSNRRVVGPAAAS